MDTPIPSSATASVVAPPHAETHAGSHAGSPAGPPPLSSPPPVHVDRRRRGVGWRSKDVLRAAALVIGLYLALRLLWFANELVFVVFLGTLFGLAVARAVDYLERWRIRRGIAAALVVLSFLVALFGIGAWVAPTLREQGAVLREQLPRAVDRIESWINQRSGLFGMFLDGSETAPRPSSAAGTPQGPATGTTD